MPQQYYDVNGKPILVPNEPPPQQAQPSSQKYFDINGNPLLLPGVAPQLSGQQTAAPPSQKQTEDVVAPYLGRLAANALPMAGSFIGPEGTGGGIVLNQLLRHLAPNVFGQPPEGVSGHLESAAGDLLVNEGIPRVVGKAAQLLSTPTSSLLKNFPAVRDAVVKRISSEAMGSLAQRPSSDILEEMGNAAQYRYTPPQPSGEYQPIKILPGQDYTPLTKTTSFQPFKAPEVMPVGETKFSIPAKPGNPIGDKLLKLNQDVQAQNQLVYQGKPAVTDVARLQSYKDLANSALADLSSVRNTKLAAGPELTEQLALSKLFTKNFSESSGKLDAGKILDTLADKSPAGEAYREAISPQTQANLSKFANEIQSQVAGHKISDGVVSYSNHRLLWTLAAFGGLHEGLAIPGLAAAAISITNSQLARVMSNPATTDLVIAAMRTPAKAPQAGLISRALATIFQGAGVTLGTPEK